MDFKKFVVDWNNKYPVDRWFRKKNNIRFNSPEHRASNLVDVYFEYIEDELYQKAQQRFNNLELKSEKYKKEGWLTERKSNLDDSFFSDLDLSLFDDN